MATRNANPEADLKEETQEEFDAKIQKWIQQAKDMGLEGEKASVHVQKLLEREDRVRQGMKCRLQR